MRNLFTQNKGGEHSTQPKQEKLEVQLSLSLSLWSSLLLFAKYSLPLLLKCFFFIYPIVYMHVIRSIAFVSSRILQFRVVRCAQFPPLHLSYNFGSCNKELVSVVLSIEHFEKFPVDMSVSISLVNSRVHMPHWGKSQ